VAIARICPDSIILARLASRIERKCDANTCCARCEKLAAPDLARPAALAALALLSG
jgi:hypothetical protein